MRITSGILKGRTFKVPKEGVRPTTERTREAVFSSVAAYVPEARVLDLFAGAGGLGLEAWSRGAASVTAVENVSKHWKNLQKNFQTLEPTAGLGAWEVVRADVYDYLKRPVGPFDLIFADPPYDEVDVPLLLNAVGDALAPDGLLVFEMQKRDSYTLPAEWILLKEKKYSSTKVIFLERNHE
ncbi:MAG: 16S rRNA (guanine(966)-N(2))-methyltransferase RsmD [Kiritimatiellales bacterium]|nr:16S rRNA (guanine(966)-N(2))-methyltransferase RsmD [Kiritimatiellota bacterium]MBL7011617.1 16S rRNA (guanine(966)-N(2))-methyltransferase RsmD [Kiritimatiellales bacterium]